MRHFASLFLWHHQGSRVPHVPPTQKYPCPAQATEFLPLPQFPKDLAQELIRSGLREVAALFEGKTNTDHLWGFPQVSTCGHSEPRSVLGLERSLRACLQAGRSWLMGTLSLSTPPAFMFLAPLGLCESWAKPAHWSFFLYPGVI